ncbi:MAG: serine/threonine-protein kinase [Planctomycetota bacterium]
MHEPVSDEQLWSWVDRDAPELAAWLAAHPEDAARVAELRSGIGAVAQVAAVPAGSLPARIGNYEVTGLLGTGGMGVVYTARHPGRPDEVAVKVIQPWFLADTRVRERFARECAILQRLDHPAIVTAYEIGGTEQGLPFLAMELVRGRTLQEHVREPHLGRRERLALFATICTAVHAAHEAGVVHRDLKPSNILVDADGAPRLLDFGLARLADSDLGSGRTESGRMLGTLPYMSPEQLLGQWALVDRRTDVYGLGVVLYELLTGRLPHAVAGAPLPTAVRTICEEPPIPPASVDASLRGDLEAILLTALAKSPERRYPSAAALADDIERHLRGAPVLGSERPRSRWAVPHRAWLLAAGLSLLVAAAWLWSHRAPWFGVRATRYPTLSAFSAMREDDGAIEVQVDDDVWYRLMSIDGVTSDRLVAFAQATCGPTWWKRITEDLVELMSRMGYPPGDVVDLSLVRPGDERPVAMRVPMTQAKRRMLWTANQEQR